MQLLMKYFDCKPFIYIVKKNKGLYRGVSLYFNQSKEELPI